MVNICEYKLYTMVSKYYLRVHRNSLEICWICRRLNPNLFREVHYKEKESCFNLNVNIESRMMIVFLFKDKKIKRIVNYLETRTSHYNDAIYSNEKKIF